MMTSLKDGDATDASREDEKQASLGRESKELSDLPPTGTSLHKRRRGEPPASLSVKSPQTPSDAEGSSPCTARTPEDWSLNDGDMPDAELICESMLQRLKEKNDALSRRGTQVAQHTKETMEALDQLEKLLELLDQLVALKEHNARLVRRLRDVKHLKKLHSAHKKIDLENEKLRYEYKELELIQEALDAELECEYGQMLFDSMMTGGRMKRSGSKWKGHARFGGSLLRKQRSRSAGGDDSDVAPGTPLRRRSEGVFSKEVDKSRISKWTKVKAAFRWEKAQWAAGALGGAAGAVAAGAMVGAVALAGSSPAATLHNAEPRDSASLTPGSALSLTPNSSCEELRMEASCRKGTLHGDEINMAFLQAPPQDDSSASPSPNKLHKSPWGKMRDMIQTHRESVKKKSVRGWRGSRDALPPRRRSLSDGGDSDAPPALTLTIPSSEELECEPAHPVLRKQRSLELGARPPQLRPARASKWSKVKRAFLTSASASVPSSPNRHSAFFTDAETEGVSSGCEAGGVRDEIARDYAALQSRLHREFSARRDKLHAARRPPPSRQALYASRPVATEEQLSVDFRNQLTEWKKKGVKQPLPVPARQDLSEDFLKKWDEWKRMKETNSVPAWEEETKPDEVLVQTSTGLFKFKGISRSFTRKLHEWEKSRGIAPEASTSALLRAAKARGKISQPPLTRTQSDGSVAPSAAGSGRLHASSLSVNDVDDFDSEYEREHSLDGLDEQDSPHSRGALIVEVEAEEVCTAAPLMAVSPRHTPQKPVYTYGQAEARLLCETSSAVTGTAVLQPNGAVILSESRRMKPKETGARSKPIKEQTKQTEKNRRMLSRQTSIEEDAMFIKKAIEEVERGSSRYRDDNLEDDSVKEYCEYERHEEEVKPLKTPVERVTKQNAKGSRESVEDDNRKKDADKNNGKKKTKSRARLEREQSKPSESDTEPEVSTVTVEIPRRRKRPRRTSEKPRTPPASLHSDSEGEVFVLKFKAPEPRDRSPEVIVKTTRKIFSPVVRSGESVPRAVIPVDVEDLAEVRPSEHTYRNQEVKKREQKVVKYEKKQEENRSKSANDLLESEDQKNRSRPPLPSSPSSQRKPQPKETAPSIRIMIQRYNKKINEEGPISGASSGASSPAWRSPSTERRRPPDMPVGINIRNNPFLEREVQKSASACQLSRRENTTNEKILTPATSVIDGVLKSHSANALHPEQYKPESPPTQHKIENSQETITGTASTDTIVPRTANNSEIKSPEGQPLPVMRQMSETIVPSISKLVADNPGLFARSISSVEPPATWSEVEGTTAVLSERAARLKAAREKFLSSSAPMRREGTSSASDLRPADRSSRISCESDVTESQSSSNQESAVLGRSASTGMVSVERDAWQRVAGGARGASREGGGCARGARGRARFSLARLAAKLRRKEDGAVSRLCRQSLLVHLINKQ